MFDYVTTMDKAREWGISQRMVNKFCANGRIDGAEMVGRTWFIPRGSTKPTNLRRLRRQKTNP